MALPSDSSMGQVIQSINDLQQDIYDMKKIVQDDHDNVVSLSILIKQLNVSVDNIDKAIHNGLSHSINEMTKNLQLYESNNAHDHNMINTHIHELDRRTQFPNKRFWFYMGFMVTIIAALIEVAGRLLIR